MSDNEDYYSDSDSDKSDIEDEKPNKIAVKKNIINKGITVNDFDDENDDETVPSSSDEEDDDENVDDDEEEEEEEEEEDDFDEIMQVGGDDDKKVAKKKEPTKKIIEENDDDDYDDEDDDDEENENYLQKFNEEISKNYIHDYHPECLNENYEEIIKLSKVIRDSNGIIIDPFHKTIPFLTKYEKTRILGQRAKQIENGAKPFINVPETIIDSYIIAELELQQKKIPFIIRRPLPSGAFEYWNVKDLDNLAF